ncbi:hypothetical protein BGX27_005993 [Mortierella sp. AM989]|nr:hypothetical protein BGX27_005993 [Mortierella sp. AM989]
MSCCPLCGDTVAKFTLSFHSEFLMCSNEDCVYPFQDDNEFKASVIDKRPPGSQSASRKRKALSTLNDSTTSDAKPRLIKKPRPVDPLKTKQSEEALSCLSTTSIPQKSSLPSTAPMAVLPRVIPRLSSIPSMESSVASPESIIALPMDLEAILATSSSISSIPASPIEGVPDLVFDFLPSGSWITPVTPPDNPTQTDINAKGNIIGSAVGSTLTTTNSIENLLFDEEFDIDFNALQGVNPALEFDPDFEAMLRQQF